ncbi:MAG: zinc-dependent metalloprotease, partial [Gemmatimonadota bacterium]|nr:zinc-dependent metalloprotease [Gemmatimonadota bacterium]
SKAVLVNITGFLLSDYADLGENMKFYFRDRPPSFDKERSAVARVMGFPRNMEVDADLTYRAPGAPAFGDAAALGDYRSIPVTLRYSFFALPDTMMAVREGDDRVGFFLDAVYDFSRDRQVSSFRTMVNRWRLEKKDPSAALSDPVKPIVYYVDRSVPLEYRPFVKAGIEAWNKGFEAAGFTNAIVAMDAPDDSTWSAEDIRYSTVRWTASYRMGYAIGPSQTDPRTGEILNADVLISATFPRGWLFEWQELASPEAFRAAARRFARPMLPEQPGLVGRLCLYEQGLAQQLGAQHAILAGLGALPGTVDSVPLAFVGEALKELVMHEVGHTIGLRHNFKSSSGTPNARLHDTGFTRKNGVALSVMDYSPANIASDPRKQGDFYNHEVGSYDTWAIRYGYSVIAGAETPADERTALRKIASEAADPLHTYGTDEDNWLGPYAVDPLTNAWELGADPVQWGADRVSLARKVEPSLESRLIPAGNGYQRLRGATISLLFERLSALLPLTKEVGGLYFARDHKGDPSARPPFTPVPAERQRKAVEVITANAFAEDAFKWSPELLNKLAPNRLSHWGTGYGATPVEFAANEYASSVQIILLAELLDQVRLERMINNESRVASGQAYTVAELFPALTTAIWAEFAADGKARNAVALRRQLQRAHLDQLSALLLPSRPGAWMVEDARSIARAELQQVDARLAQAEKAGGLDRMTQAHIAESRASIERTLQARMVLPPGAR